MKFTDIDILEHDLEYVLESTYNIYYQCKKCKINIKRSIDSDNFYYLTKFLSNDTNYYTCNEIVIKNIIE